MSTELALLIEELSRPPPPTEGGAVVRVDERRDFLLDQAERVDLVARAIHDRIAYELDSLGGATYSVASGQHRLLSSQLEDC